MSTEQIILWALGSLTAAGGVIAFFLKTVVPRMVDAKIDTDTLVTRSKIEAESYERARETFKQDTTFELLKETLNYLLKELEADREEAKESRKQQSELIHAIERVARNVDQNTQILRMVVQTLSVHGDRLEKMERKLSMGGDEDD